MKDRSPEERSVLEVSIRSMSWKALVRILKDSVEQSHRPLELSPMIRRWLELNRTNQGTEEDAAHLRREIQALQTYWDGWGERSADKRWFEDKVEFAPISGWIVSLCHVLKDGARWWILTAKRHDDHASLVGPTVPAPATKADLKKLGKIVSYAGGDAKRELLRTGAITQEEHDAFIAVGSADIAEYGEIFFWWRA